MRQGLVQPGRRRLLGAAAATLFAGAQGAGAAQAAGATDVEWHDAKRKRHLKIRFRFPATAPPWPLIIYSPGLGSGADNGSPWCNHWRDHGMMVATITHPETADDIWDVSNGTLHAQLTRALDGGQLGKRVKDCRFVIDQGLGRVEFARLIDPARIAAAGHSYGALTVQALSGQYRGSVPQFHEPRIRAAIALSPGAVSAAAAKSASGITIPFLCMTGDHDGYVDFGDGSNGMRLGVPLDNRIAVYRSLARGRKHLLLLNNADHMTFAGESLPPGRFRRAIAATRASETQAWDKISRVSQYFLAHYLSDDSRLAVFETLARAAIEGADRFESR